MKKPHCHFHKRFAPTCGICKCKGTISRAIKSLEKSTGKSWEQLKAEVTK